MSAIVFGWPAAGEATVMVRKKVEGNEQQRRAAARRARREGGAPSAEKVTTGASKQRSHHRRHEPHEQKAAAIDQGKQEWQAAWSALEADRGLAAGEPDQSFAGRENPGYTPAHAQVFRAVVEAQRDNDGQAVFLDEIARRSGVSQDQARLLLHDLAVVHRLVTELQGSDTLDLGPRFEEKPRL
jgi:hypothetical protein